MYVLSKTELNSYLGSIPPFLSLQGFWQKASASLFSGESVTEWIPARPFILHLQGLICGGGEVRILYVLFGCSVLLNLLNMECNRDEALRAKTIAEEKLERKDFAGAKKFAEKAQDLYPGLDGIPQLVTTLNVYASAENKKFGEVDWYAVLGVNPSADDEAIRKQYRKLALLLHPDKNSSPGADEAFTLISQAWNLLSDKGQRLMYNQRMGNALFQRNVQVPAWCPAARTTEAVFKNHSNGMRTVADFWKSGPKVPQKPPPPPPPPPPAPSSGRTDTFWTTCPKCRYHFEYEKKYLNLNLLCVTCKSSFFALETSPPKFKKGTGSNIQAGSAPGSDFQAGSVSLKIAKKRKMAKRVDTGM